MRTSAVVVAALAAGASAWSNDTVVYTTQVVTAYTTYCPAPTVITHGTQTYTVTKVSTSPTEVVQSRVRIAISIRELEHLTRNATSSPEPSKLKANPLLLQATTLTITNCPCTVTKPVITSTATYCPTWYPHCNLPQSSSAIH